MPRVVRSTMPNDAQPQRRSLRSSHVAVVGFVAVCAVVFMRGALGDDDNHGAQPSLRTLNPVVRPSTHLPTVTRAQLVEDAPPPAAQAQVPGAVAPTQHRAQSGATTRVVYSHRAAWTEPGDAGWLRASRVAGESHLSCPIVAKEVEEDYAAAAKRYKGFTPSPSFKMPWYFHDPHPVCGQQLLRHLFGAPKHALAARLASQAHSPRRDAMPAPRGSRPADGSHAALRLDSGVDHATETVHATAGKATADIYIEDCGMCRDPAASSAAWCADSDVLVTARLVGYNAFAALPVWRVAANGALRLVGTVAPTAAEVAAASAATSRGSMFRVAFTAHAPGVYALEVKVVHLNGTSDDPKKPRSLGVIGIRAVDGGRKAFKYNAGCDEQRHVVGSPFRVVVHAAGSDAIGELTAEGSTTVVEPVPPFCTSANHTRGRWVRFTDTTCRQPDSPLCAGDPSWLTDASAYNTDYLWVPDGCRYRYYSPPAGPRRACLAMGSRGFLLLVGDSVTREYAKNCLQFDLRPARMQCLFANIALEGQHFSTDYARAVVDVIIENIKTNNAAVLATNLGIHHMIGPCSTAQWREFVALFVAAFQREVVWANVSGRQLQTAAGRAYGDGTLPAKYPKGQPPRLERAVWMGPPTIHYARKGMGLQRGHLWDEIAWAALEPLGFERLNALVPTASRQEGTWDGLHYASERNKVQTRWRNKHVAPRTWNGGVANTLFVMLLNLLCPG